VVWFCLHPWPQNAEVTFESALNYEGVIKIMFINVNDKMLMTSACLKLRLDQGTKKNGTTEVNGVQVQMLYE